MLRSLTEKCPSSRILENEPMSAHTTFKTGGPARWFLEAGSEADVYAALSLAKDAGVSAFVLGRGSNLLVADEGLNMLVIEIGDRMSQIACEGHRLTAQAGARLSALSQEAARRGLSGLEFAAGIPGSVGGGTAMNAGAYGGQLSDCLSSARLLEDGRVLDAPAAEMELGYRSSRVLARGGVVFSASFDLRPDDPALISARMQDFNRRRREKQPLSYPSAGSVFKRPEGHFAGALIEQAGLKGCRVGDAMVSDLHAGFIINLGRATSSDILALIRRVQAVVLETSGVALEPEIRMLGF